jgi:hypothetical protein
VSFFLQGVWEKSLQAPESASLQFRFNSLSSIRLVKRVPQPALRERKKKKKQLKGKNLRSPFFCPLLEQKPPNALSLSFHRKHICLTEYIGGQKPTSSGIPIHASKGVLLLAMQALLVTLIVIF